MPTKKMRSNITLEPDTTKELEQMAKKEKKSLSKLLRELVLDALERREDFALSALAEDRDNDDEELVSHDEAWK